MSTLRIGDIITVEHYGKGEVIHLRSQREIKVRLDKAVNPYNRRNIICFPNEVLSVESPKTGELQPSDITEIQKGMLVLHRTFGRGTVIKTEERSRGERVADVDFFTAGKKTLLLSYAQLQIISF